MNATNSPSLQNQYAPKSPIHRTEIVTINASNIILASDIFEYLWEDRPGPIVGVSEAPGMELIKLAGEDLQVFRRWPE